MTNIEWTDVTWNRFLTYVDKPDGDGCWLWKGGTFKGRGYGQFRVGAKKMRAHRVSWERYHGPIPDGMRVCHRCDTPACVRPDHLFLGTDADNARDRDAKGRGTLGRIRPEAASPGAANPAAKLNDAAVLSIRRLRAQGAPYRDIAERHGISISEARNVATRRTWSHVQ